MRSLPVAKLHLERARWDLFLLRYRLEAGGLETSVRAAGIIEPLIVEEWQRGYRVIAGFRRAVAARAAGIERVRAVVFAKGILSPRDAYLMAVASNAPGAALCDLDKALTLRLGSERFGLSESELITMVAPLLGLPPSFKVVRLYIGLTRLPHVILESLADGRISRQHAEAMLLLPPSQREEIFHSAVRAFDLSASETRLLSEGLVDLAAREKRPPSEILGEIVAQALEAGSATPVTYRQGKPRLREILRQRLLPTVSQMEEEFAGLARKLNLPAGATVGHSPAFESDELILEAKVADGASVLALKDALERGLAGGTFEQMLSIASRKAARILGEKPTRD